MSELGTVEQELAACRKAFVGVRVGDPVRCCHHDVLVEILDYSPEVRISFIQYDKPRQERARRFHEMRPIPRAMYDDYEAKRKLLDYDYEAKRKLLYDDYEAKRKPLADDYEAKRKPLYDDYWAKREPLDDDYEAKRKPLDDDYEAKRRLVQPIVSLVPDSTWDGNSIFGES